MKSLNNLTGKISIDICDLNVNFSYSYYFNISDNQLCLPYPECIEENIGEQNTSDCGD